MALTPDRAVVLTASSTNIYDIMAAYYADIGNSNWSATDQTTTSGVGSDPAGSFSMTLRNQAGGLELNMLNNGTPGSPSTNAVRLGINPDGSSDAITKSEDPYDSGSGPANFSGTDNGKLVTVTIGNVEFIVLEWPDALAFIFKDATRRYASGGLFWGKLMENPMPAQASSSELRLDGHFILGHLPTATGSGSWGTTSLNRRRVSLGTSVATSLPQIGGWTDYNVITSSFSTVIDRYQFGTKYEMIPGAIMAGGGANSAEQYLHKYLRAMYNDGCYCFNAVVVGSQTYMMLHNAAPTSESPLCIAIPSDFVPNPP